MSPANGDSLAVSVWLRLLKAQRLVHQGLRRAVPEALTLPQLDVLIQLARRPGGTTPGELTRALLVTAGNVTGIVERLSRRRLVERRSVPHDRRAVAVRLTARGRRLLGRAVPRHRREIARALAKVPRASLARLRRELGTLTAALDEGLSAAPAGRSGHITLRSVARRARVARDRTR